MGGAKLLATDFARALARTSLGDITLTRNEMIQEVEVTGRFWRGGGGS